MPDIFNHYRSVTNKIGIFSRNFTKYSPDLLFNRPIITYKAETRFEKGLNIVQSDDLIGAIVRSIEDPDELRNFDYEGYSYNNEISNADNWVFCRG